MWRMMTLTTHAIVSRRRMMHLRMNVMPRTMYCHSDEGTEANQQGQHCNRFDYQAWLYIIDERIQRERERETAPTNNKS
jgi:hypothetical protein